jgi:cytoskeletal protein RodZ
MDSFALDLKNAREAKGITLSDISEATLINVSLLEAIEQGNYAILPQAYVRAFIREYAGIVGLDPDEVIQRYDTQVRQAVEPPQGGGEAPTTPQPARPPVAEPSRNSSTLMSPRLARTALIGIAVVALGIALWNLLRDDAGKAVPEIPFQSVMKESERRAADEAQSVLKKDTVPPQPRDSLLLSAVTTDTVWVHLVIDGQAPRDYIFKPNMKMSWKALNRFSVTLGNAGAIQFTLNKKNLGTLGLPGRVVRNVELTRHSLSAK